jgi:hypothetical protein
MALRRLDYDAIRTLREQGLTHYAIAEQLGCSYQGVHSALARMGLADIGRNTGGVERICETCGVTFRARRFQVQRGLARFCSMACFGKSPANKSYDTRFQPGSNKPPRRKIDIETSGGGEARQGV